MKTEAIVAIGDLHLDALINGRDYHEDVTHRLTTIAPAIGEDDLVVILGDVCDPNNGARTTRAQSTLARWVESLRCRRRVIVIPGNHCVHDDVRAGSVLDVFKTHPRFQIIDRVEVLDYETHRLLFMPWLSRAHGSVDVEGLVGDAIGEDPRPVIGFCHLDIPGAALGSEDEMPRGGRLELPMSVVEDPRVERILAVHLHRAQTLGKVQVVGSLERLGFRDSDGERGYMVVEIDS